MPLVRYEGMTDLFAEKLKRLDDVALFQECVEMGKLLEKHMSVNGFLPPEFKIRGAQVFYEAMNRPTLEAHKMLFETALKVIALL
jgi:hypothetical protein